MDEWSEIDVLPDGSVRDTRGRTYVRTPARVRRANGRTLVEAGAIIVTRVYPEGVRAYVGSAAVSAWAEILPRLSERQSGRVIDLEWKGHVYTTEEGDSLLYFDGDH